MVIGQTDEELMLRYRDGDAAAFETLYQRYEKPLFDFIFRMAPNATDSGMTLVNVPLDGGKPKEILDLGGKGFTERFWELSWLPDGKRIAFMAEPETDRGNSSLICVASIKTGEINELATDDKGWKDGFFLSPDGKWFSYYTDEFIKMRPSSTIWEVKVEDLVKEKK